MAKKRKRQQNRAIVQEPVRADPIAVWLNGGDAADMLCPKGYTPISQNEEVIKCAHKIADMVSSMTIMLIENGANGDIRIKNELSRKLDIAPNRNMTRKNFIYKLVFDMAVYGNSLAYPVYRDGLLYDIQLWDAEKVHFQESGDSYIIRYGTGVFNPDEVLHFSLNPDPRQPFRGTGFTRAVKQAVENLIQANTTKTGFLQSKWKPSMIISVAADVEELIDSKERSRIVGSYTKTTEIGEPWLIPAGEIDVKTIQPLTLNDLAVQDSITLDKRVIAAAFGIPSFLVGIGEFNKEEYNNFIATTIMSVAMVPQQELTRKILHKPNWYFKFNPKSLMQFDLNEKTEFIKAMVSGGMMTRNEGRNEFDYAPADDKGMNEFIVLENYVPVSKVGDQKKLREGENDE